VVEPTWYACAESTPTDSVVAAASSLSCVANAASISSRMSVCDSTIAAFNASGKVRKEEIEERVSE
jgi:hypothetical protein